MCIHICIIYVWMYALSVCVSVYGCIYYVWMNVSIFLNACICMSGCTYMYYLCTNICMYLDVRTCIIYVRMYAGFNVCFFLSLSRIFMLPSPLRLAPLYSGPSCVGCYKTLNDCLPIIHLQSHSSQFMQKLWSKIWLLSSIRTAWWRRACCLLGWGSMSIGDPSKSR